jgi:hypothetical protein
MIFGSKECGSVTSVYLQRVHINVEMSKDNKKRKSWASSEKVGGFCFAATSEESQ